MSIDRNVVIGVEMASSRATVALIDRHGRILHRSLVKTLRGRPAHATLEPYFNAIDTMIAYAHAQMLCVCVYSVSAFQVRSMLRCPETSLYPNDACT